MSPTLGSGKISWSTCSKRYLNQFLATNQVPDDDDDDGDVYDNYDYVDDDDDNYGDNYDVKYHIGEKFYIRSMSYGIMP